MLVRARLDEGRLSAGHGRALLGASDPEGLAARVLKEGLSVRQTEALARAGGKRTRRSADPNILHLEKRLGDATGLKVAIRAKGETGRVILTYRNLDQLDDVIARLERRG